jgi:pimeloyl-ACP methyl ester carboxylesterase
MVMPVPPSLAEVNILSPIPDTISPQEWLYAGPFSVGAREGVAGVIDDVREFRPEEGLEHRSILVQGGTVQWKKTQIDSLGWVNLEYEEVLWDSLMDVWGIAGVVDVGYAYTEIESKKRGRAFAVTHRPGSFFLNGVRYYGNPYGDGYMKTPVIVEDGLNRILVATSGYGDHRFRFKLVPAPYALEIVGKDATLPDILENELLDSWAGITVMNATGGTLEDVTVTVGDEVLFQSERIEKLRLDPLSIRKVPIRVRQLEYASVGDSVWLPVELSSSGFAARDSLWLRVRGNGQSYVRTFLSRIDSSCQYYAVLPPENIDPGLGYGLILTLHGAGVRASGQVDSYEPKDWAFVVAPTNRRKFGFDWQDWGRLDALEVLEQAMNRLPVDTNRICLTGHSMGGHGTWHVGLAHPDRFAAMAPAAGWTCFQLYVPWFLQKAYAFAHPMQIAIRDMSLREDFAPNFVENTSNLPVFILHGGVDDNVPTVHGRMFAKLLDGLGYEYVYKEDPGKGHWYRTEDGLCVDDPDLMDFLKERRRDPSPVRVVFKTTNLGQTSKSYWVEIAEQEKPFFESRIEAAVSGKTVEIEVTNIREFTLSIPKHLLPPGAVTFVVNGREITHRLKENERVTFRKERGRFKLGRLSRKGLKKTPDLYGPIKQAYFSPFTLVYGTKGDSTVTEMLYRQARGEALRWWHRANGCADVLSDVELDDEVVKHRNLIVFGGPEENHFTSRIADRLPIRVEEGEILVGSARIEGEGLAAGFIYPNPLNQERFVFVRMGNDSRGLRISSSFGALYSGAGLPDFLVFDESVRTIGWGGVLCAGFFDAGWSVDERLMYLPE